MSDELLLHPASRAAWEAWLERHHADRPDGVAVRVAHGVPPEAGLTVIDALEVALCFGWLDGWRKRVDDVWSHQRFVPRPPGSRWSPVNRRAAERLIASGAMRPAGLAAVRDARADGRFSGVWPPGPVRVVAPGVPPSNADV